MMDLTGFPTESIELPNPSKLTKHKLKELENLWQKLSEYSSEGMLICCETPGEDDLTENGGHDKVGGLVPGHAYSILKVKQSNAGHKLLNIRNPWGRFEWDGDWSDHSDLWTYEMINEIKPVLEDTDGAFWMCWEDFYARF
jgi:calpain-15